MKRKVVKEESFKELISIVKETLTSNRDFIMVVTGRTGEGKSTFLVWSALKYLASDENFDIRKLDLNNIISFSKEDFANKIKESPKYHVIIGDEAVNLLFSREFANREQIEIIKLLNMYRNKCFFYGFAIAQFFQLDKAFREDLVRLWIHIPRRGYAYLFAPDQNPFAQDKWNRKVNQDIFKFHGTNIYPEKSPNFIGLIRFRALPEKIEKVYEEIKENKRAEIKMKVEAPKVPRCPNCNSISYRYYPAYNKTLCRKCGTILQDGERKPDFGNKVNEVPTTIIKKRRRCTYCDSTEIRYYARMKKTLCRVCGKEVKLESDDELGTST